LRDLGIDSYIPKLPRYQPYTFIPYVYCPKQTQSIFSACDDLRLEQAYRNSDLLVIPVLIRLLYATGLRIGETSALTLQDDNLYENWLRVKDSKNGKERIIPISNSLASVCAQYARYRAMLSMTAQKSPYFFVGVGGKKCSHQAVRAWFKKCLKRARISRVSRN